jgi:hypothetical protein
MEGFAMAYEIFTNKGSRRTSAPAIGIAKSGRVNLNKPITQHLLSKKVEFVLLLWDKERNRIAIKPSKRDSRAYQLGYSNRDNSAGFHGGSFVKYIGYDNSQARTLYAEWNEKEGMYEVEVREEYLMKNEKTA